MTQRKDTITVRVMPEIRKAMAPVQPNAAHIRGKVVGIKREGDGSNWEVAVDEVRDVGGMANFAQSEVGKTISVYVHPDMNCNIARGDAIEAQVAFRGDEKGGRFVVSGDDVRKQSN